MIKETIEQEMNDRKIRKADLSRGTGIHPNQITSFFKGKSLSIPNLEKVCKFLNLVLVKKF